MNTFVVQLSDTHVCAPGSPLYGWLDTGGMLRAAVTSVLKLRQRADAVVLTGDLVNSGAAVEYERLGRLLAPLSMPVYLMPGNHDDREALRKAFPRHVYLGRDGFIQYTARIGGLRLIALDTLVPGEEYGQLCDIRLAWLARTLAACRDDTVILALHHPPFRSMLGYMDKVGLRHGAPELEKLVASYPNIARVVCGHLHRTVEAFFGGTLAMCAPSTAHQIVPDFAPEAPPMWEVSPPAFRLHIGTEAGAVVSHLLPSGEYAGPYPFG